MGTSDYQYRAEQIYVVINSLTRLTPDQLIDLWYGPGPFQDQVVTGPMWFRLAWRHCATTTVPGGDQAWLVSLARSGISMVA